MGEQRAGQGRVGFLDDDLEFIETLDVWKDESQASVLITSSPEEFLGWVRERKVEIAVSDVRMPGEGGVRVLERAREMSPEVNLVALTAYEPNAEEQSRLNEIGATVKLKTDEFCELLEALEGKQSPMTRRLAHLQGRVSQYERMIATSRDELLGHLEQVENRDAPIASGDADPLTMGGLIEEVKRKSPTGLKHIGLWKRALSRLEGMGIDTSRLRKSRPKE